MLQVICVGIQVLALKVFQRMFCVQPAVFRGTFGLTLPSELFWNSVHVKVPKLRLLVFDRSNNRLPSPIWVIFYNFPWEFFHLFEPLQAQVDFNSNEIQ